MIVNEKTPLSRAMYWELKRQAPEGIPVYQQEILEPDVWHILDGDKDDFLIYDRSVSKTFFVLCFWFYFYTCCCILGANAKVSSHLRYILSYLKSYLKIFNSLA